MRPISSKIEGILAEFGEVASDRRAADHSTRKLFGGLTSRQFEILQALSEGLSNKEIASRLFLSTRTVDMHVRNIFDSLNCRNRADAVKIAMDLGILD
jgi:DNA-binding NarL/FixJ family response regulator